MCTSSRALVAQMHGLYRNAVYQRLLRLTRLHEDAAELTQDTFVALLEAIRSGQTINDPHAWLMKTAYKLWCNWCSRRTKATTRLEGRDRQPGAGQSALEGMIAVEAAERLRAAVQRLPANHQAVLVFTVLEDMSYAQAAESLGASSKMVNVWRTRALARLREGLLAAPDPRSCRPLAPAPAERLCPDARADARQATASSLSRNAEGFVRNGSWGGPSLQRWGTSTCSNSLPHR
jgi:RNA polymerase sigma factor (sigma-70 family)